MEPYPQHSEFTARTDQAIQLAIEEDSALLDITAEATIPADLYGTAEFLVKEPNGIILCGQPIVSKILAEFGRNFQNPPLEFSSTLLEGALLSPRERFGHIHGPMRSLLKAERVALNFLQRMSGIATLTKRFCDAVQGTSAIIVDTRKTDPCLREISKYAVRVGGGTNHRSSLADMFLVKNNHVDAVNGDIREAIRRCRAYAEAQHLSAALEVEVRNTAELQSAIEAEPDIIMLDNFSPAEATQAVGLIRSSSGSKRIWIEASGGVNEQTVRAYAESGVDFISVGALTHSYPVVDLALRVKAL